MSQKYARVLTRVFSVLVVLAIVGTIWFQQMQKSSYPQIDGTINLPGLDGPVDVYRDPLGIPHIYASTEHDLFMVQGYVQSQDRFWQMDVQRHSSRGRLSELIGSNTLGTDKFLRTLGWERVAEQEVDMLDPKFRATLQAYADGVNAYLADHSGSRLSLEYLFLNLLNPGYEPQPWELIDSVSWAKAMAWDLRGNMSEEIDRAMMLAQFSPEQIADLYPAYPSDRPVIVQDFGSAGLPLPAENAALTATIQPALAQIAAQFSLADQALGVISDESVGSNSWAVSGALTDTGMPLLANDPHLGAAIPHIWYQTGLHCRPKGPDCQIDMVGFSFVGVPSIVIGHNDHIAWGFTNVGPDVIDLFIEKINPDNPNQYEFQGEWVDMDVITETIRIGKDDSEDLTVRLTHHGPIISDTFGALDGFADSGLDLPENYAISISWPALTPNNTMEAVFGFAYAQSFEEFRAAASDFAVPAQNLLYADVNGNIGYQMPGWIPIRPEGADGLYPAPGWTGEYDWQGYIPFEELPYAFNPPEGYIVTANNPVVGAAYPYHIADTWAYGYRAQRIVDLIIGAPAPIDVAYFQQMQNDSYNLVAPEFVSALLRYGDWPDELNYAWDLLASWDYSQPKDSPAAALYNVFWKNLILLTFQDQLDGLTGFEGGGRWMMVMENLLQQPDSAWWDDASTPEVETRDEILSKAFAAAVAELEGLQGKDPANWNWGELHGLYLQHAVMDSFPLINTIFNRGPFAQPSGSSQVNNQSWNTEGEDYRISGNTPSFRMIVDFSNFNNSLVIHPTGQSGHAGHPHYVDMAELYSTGQYSPMYFDLNTLQGVAEGHLLFEP